MKGGTSTPVFLTDTGPGSVPEASPYVYGPAYSLIAHAANVVAGNESTGDVSNYAAAWETRHLVVALIGLLTAAAAGLAVWLLTASRRFALWGAAGLLAFPIWVGMSLFNPKDVPVAAGYTLFTVGLLLALGRGRRVGTTLSERRCGGSVAGGGVLSERRHPPRPLGRPARLGGDLRGPRLGPGALRWSAPRPVGSRCGGGGHPDRDPRNGRVLPGGVLAPVRPADPVDSRLRRLLVVRLHVDGRPTRGSISTVVVPAGLGLRVLPGAPAAALGRRRGQPVQRLRESPQPGSIELASGNGSHATTSEWCSSRNRRC